MSLAKILSKDLNFGVPALSSLRSLEVEKEKILDRWPDVVANPPVKDRERLVLEVLRRWQTNEWEGTYMSFISQAVRALFDTERQARADLSDLRKFFYKEIKISKRRSFLDAMLSIYLVSYQPRAAHTKELASALASNQDRIGARGRQLIEKLPVLLDPVRAPVAIADQMTLMEDCWSGLKLLGLRTPHSPGLMDHAHLAFVEKVRPSLDEKSALKHLFSWLKPEGQNPRMAGASEAITAVLDPWLTRDPPQDDLRFIIENLIGIYGDPRVDGGGAWAGVPSDNLAILMRWLTGENIRFFLDVVSAVETSHMWEPRRKFWLSLYNQERIDAAWVAFSASGATHARRQLASRGNKSVVSFGRQIAGGSRNETSLLILKIGNKIVVEGSHNYKVHIFKANNPKAPKLYQPSYDCEVIRAIAGAEAKSHLGDWQSWLLERV